MKLPPVDPTRLLKDPIKVGSRSRTGVNLTRRDPSLFEVVRQENPPPRAKSPVVRAITIRKEALPQAIHVHASTSTLESSWQDDPISGLFKIYMGDHIEQGGFR